MTPGQSAGLSWTSALREAVRPPCLKRSVIAAGVVGTTLMVANLGGRLTSEPLTAGIALQAVLTYAVPWGNATVGIAMGLKDRGK